jgi:hypothetical protein
MIFEDYCDADLSEKRTVSFKIANFNSECFWPSTVFIHVESVQKRETGLDKGQWLLIKLLFTVLVLLSRALYRKGGTRSKTQTVIHAAESFRPLHAFMHVESVRKRETGLDKGRWLLRKLLFTVLVHCTGKEGPAPKRKL